MPTTEGIIKRYPGREIQIDLIHGLYGHLDEALPEFVYISGCSGVGKSSVVNATLKSCDVRCAAINLIECYTSKILFETILNKLSNHIIDPMRGLPYARCDNMMDFLFNLEKCSREVDLKRSTIILDKAEKLRDMDGNLLPGFLRLRELCSIPLSIILISELPFQKFYSKNNLTEPIPIYFPQYNIRELLDILSLDYGNALKIIKNNYVQNLNINLDFYKSYLQTVLSVFYRTCRDINELKYMSKINFVNYCKPLAEKKCKITDSRMLWNHISPILRSSLENLYLRISSKTESQIISFSNKNLAQSLELPFYAKYLLIAAYLSSYNSPKDDKRLFMKQHGKKRKTMKDIKAKNKVSEKLATQIGPKSFSFERLIAIFYSILDERVEFSNNLLVQVSTLVELQLLSTANDGCNLNGQKYKCAVGYEFIQTISKMVGFNIRKYLSDFSYI